MKFNKKNVGILLITALVSSHAQAASVFMLQFGSYQSADEAQAHLNELKSKHVGALSRLESSVRPVTLPPDNLVVYRTQAGPLATRSDAQAVCSQLASNGDSCYIVESAMVAAKPSPAPATAAAISAAPNVTIEPQVAPVLPEVRDAQTTMRDATMRDAQNIAALSAVAATPAIAPSPSVEVPEAAEATQEAINSALDSAASKQAALDQSISSTVATKKPAARSFWERINPFASSTDKVEPKPAPVAVSPEQTQIAAPVDLVIDSPAPPAVAARTIEPLPTFAEVKPLPEPVRAVTPKALVATPVAPSVNIAPTPIVAAPTIKPQVSAVKIMPPTASTPVLKAEPYPLPPPPAPLNSAEKATSRTVSTIEAPTAVAVSPLPLPTGTIPNANVRVEEAKRVPLSASTAPVAPLPVYTPTPIASAPVLTSPMPAVDLSPSSTLGQRTIWAQIGQFTSPQDALAFWNRYRQTHPDFPVVRVRVTTPVAAQRRDIAVVNLRVGPFAKQEFVTSLCRSLDPQSSLTCGAITDLGVAVNPYSNGSGQLSPSRYRR